MTPAIEEEINSSVNRLVLETTCHFCNMTLMGNAIGVHANPPEYMMRELVQFLK